MHSYVVHDNIRAVVSAPMRASLPEPVLNQKKPSSTEISAQLVIIGSY